MRILKFGSVGVLNTLVDYGVFNALVLGAGLPVIFANPLSYSAGILNSWFWNSRWTFSDRPMRYPRLAMPAFVGVNLLGLAINTGVLLVLWAAGESMGLPALLPEAAYLNAYKTVAILCSMVWNYLATRHFVFR